MSIKKRFFSDINKIGQESAMGYGPMGLTIRILIAVVLISLVIWIIIRKLRLPG
jgi:hypothetical protein